MCQHLLNFVRRICILILQSLPLGPLQEEEEEFGFLSISEARFAQLHLISQFTIQQTKEEGSLELFNS